MMIIAPMIEDAFKGISNPEIIALFDGSASERWALRATWDDFKSSLKQGNEFKKVEIVANKWLQVGTKVVHG